jgi:hypothetical protein
MIGILYRGGGAGASQFIGFIGLVSGAGKEGQEAAFSLEQAPDGFGDREGPMVVRSRRENLGSEFLGKQGGALGLTTAAEISCAA